MADRCAAAEAAALRMAVQRALDGLAASWVCAHGPTFRGNAEDDRPNDCSVCAVLGPLVDLLGGPPVSEAS